MCLPGAYAHVAAGLSPACSGSDWDAQRDSHRLTVGEWRGIGGSVAESVGIAGAVCNKPEAPAVTAGASSLPGGYVTLPVGLLHRFPADRQGSKAGGSRRECPETAL